MSVRVRTLHRGFHRGIDVQILCALTVVSLLHHTGGRVQTLLQVAQATTAMYGCSSVITWNPIAYIPVVNQAGMVARLQEVGRQLEAIKHTELLDRPTFVAEDVAFFNGEL